jgi:hypothetical protein
MAAVEPQEIVLQRSGNFQATFGERTNPSINALAQYLNAALMMLQRLRT